MSKYSSQYSEHEHKAVSNAGSSDHKHNDVSEFADASPLQKAGDERQVEQPMSLHEMANGSLQAKKMQSLQAMADNRNARVSKRAIASPITNVAQPKELTKHHADTLQAKSMTAVVQRVAGLPLRSDVHFFDKESGEVLSGKIESAGAGVYNIWVLDGPMPESDEEPPPLATMHEDIDEKLVFPDTMVKEAIAQRFSVQEIMGHRIVVDAEHFGARNEGPQLIGGNLAFVRNSPRDFAFTDGGRGSMQLDLTAGSKLDDQIRIHRNLSKAPKGLFNSAPSLLDRLNRILTSVHGVPVNKAERNKQVLERGTEDLGTMLEKGYTMCWEKAMFMHLLLTDLGINSEVLSGPMHKDEKEHHAWVGIVGTDFVVEATAGIVATRANYLKTFKVIDAKHVARPKEPLAAEMVVELVTQCEKFRPAFVPSSN